MSNNPYITPSSTAGAGNRRPVFQASQNQYSYKPLGIFALLIAIFVGLTCFSNLAISAIETLGFVVYPAFTNPDAPVGSDEEMLLITSIFGAGLLSTAASITAGVLVCMFCFRANANVRSLGATHLQFTPGWCAGWWFVPIMHLVKPFQAVKEIFQCSRRPIGQEWQSQVDSSIVPTWWAFWIIGSILTRVETRLAFSGVDLGGGGVLLSWLATGSLLVAGILLIVVVRRIDKMQTNWALHYSS